MKGAMSNRPFWTVLTQSGDGSDLAIERFEVGLFVALMRVPSLAYRHFPPQLNHWDRGCTQRSKPLGWHDLPCFWVDCRIE
jgi:hypothetical protein